ncbi:putative toxin-antitoxin system toxin component, PIN family [Cupriavidus sp.]|uniref:putative toxin-antitoxin system toxin component, PIN family n=1 Tax=Cupriavidus sp. TaxID=1873897 RepID=UPI0025BCD1BE|nr:putative toxin-antitoxin system toxin component, PIN family [Cupriavidus sp.]MCA3191333.1 putative toxin-antitoxin system toxin component, PIN family [Cupriavidus sp.]MCA3196637.1 putative toxin-antitoxin system toxin component, PIN family [Cupriavidus sp.]MCA3203216.1 putative toxin-antitoxin system toxin component, PIN family [Cupriavidus sp.]MCA3209708.1 putative toxin-antitoxin system toxin component, PIN family [Cupriavidus sp.]MCA3235840.1 putative toxin-antitoxin system toxin compone
MPTEVTAGTLPGTPSAPRVVLDSNVWVDLLVFRDPHVEPIRAALASGAIAPVIRADCREELRRVLAYPQFARFTVDIDAALAEVDRLATLETAPEPADAGTIRLPKCRDTDDQKFIELAHFARAVLLVSKDKAVLKLRSRLRRTSGVDVLTPLAFTAWLAARAAADGAANPASPAPAGDPR